MSEIDNEQTLTHRGEGRFAQRLFKLPQRERAQGPFSMDDLVIIAGCLVAVMAMTLVFVGVMAISVPTP